METYEQLIEQQRQAQLVQSAVAKLAFAATVAELTYIPAMPVQPVAIEVVVPVPAQVESSVPLPNEEATSKLSDAEVEELVRANLNLVHAIVRKLPSHFHTNHESLYVDGVIGLWQAARRFDPSKGVKFATFASERVKGAVIDELRAFQKLSRKDNEAQEITMRKDTFRLDAPNEDGSNNYELVDTFEAGPEDMMVAREEEQEHQAKRASLYAKCLAALNPKQREIVTLYNGGQEFYGIGQKLGITESRTCQIYYEAMGEMRRAMVKSGSLEIMPDVALPPYVLLDHIIKRSATKSITRIKIAGISEERVEAAFDQLCDAGLVVRGKRNRIIVTPRAEELTKTLSSKLLAHLDCASLGFSLEDSAVLCDMAVNNVRHYRSRINKVLGAKTLSHAVRIAIEKGILLTSVTEDDHQLSGHEQQLVERISLGLISEQRVGKGRKLEIRGLPMESGAHLVRQAYERGHLKLLA